MKTSISAQLNTLWVQKLDVRPIERLHIFALANSLFSFIASPCFCCHSVRVEYVTLQCCMFVLSLIAIICGGSKTCVTLTRKEVSFWFLYVLYIFLQVYVYCSTTQRYIGLNSLLGCFWVIWTCGMHLHRQGVIGVGDYVFLSREVQVILARVC